MVSEKLGAAFIEVGVDTGGLTTGLAGAKAQVEGFGASASSAFSGLVSSINPATIAIAGATAGIMAIGAAFVGSVRAAAQWQTLMVDVQKVTDTTAAGFASLSKDLLAIRGETGASMESIAGAAAGAGRMGIDPTEIAGYTETILKMSSAWGMSADAASESIGKIGSVVKPAEMTWTEFGNRMGSTINDLADSMATSEESIVTGMKKVSAQMAMLKPSPDQLSAWAALIGQLQAFGMTAETSGESLKDALNYMMRDDKSGISSMLDMDATEFQEAIREDAIGTIQELAVAISELPIEEQGQALQKFGATGGQMMGMLVGKVDPVTKEVEGLNAALETGAGAWENASSLNEAYAKSQATLNTQIDIFRGKISVAATSIGTVLLPYLTKMMEAVNDITQALIDLGTRGWQWLTGGAEGENVPERAAGKVRSWADSQGWLSGYLADYDAAKARDAGIDLGQDLTTGVAEGTEGVGPAIEGNLENVDGEGAGRKVGADFARAVSKEVKSMYELLGATSDAEAFALMGQYELLGSSDKKPKYKGAEFTAAATLESGIAVTSKYTVDKHGSKIAVYASDGTLIGERSFGNWRTVELEDAVADILSAPLEGGFTYGETLRLGGKGGEADIWEAQQKINLISPYEVWGTSQHWADYSAKYWGEIEDLTILELYNLEEALRNEGAAGWERAWEDILDPASTEAAITGALGVLSPVLEDMGYEDADSYLLGLRERVAEGGTELADSIVDAGKYQEYKLGELGESWGKALGDSMISVQEQETLLGLVDALELAGYEGAAALRAAIEAEDWEGLGALIGDRTGDAMEKTLFGRELRMKDIPALSDLIADPEALKKTVQNWEQWSSNTYQPALQHHIDEAEAKYASGYYSQSELNKDYFRDLMTNALQYSDWYEGWQLGLLGAYARGDIGLQQFFDLWENGGKAIEGASKAIAAERQNLAGLTAEASMCEEAMSSFGIAQEKMSDRLFNQTRIMNTGDYIEDVAAAIARGDWVHTATEAFARQQASDRGIDFEARVSANTEQATKDMEDFAKFVEESDSKAPISASLQPAYDAVDSFLGWANNISASVFVDAYGPGTEYTRGGGYLEGLSPGITSSPGWGTSSWLPVLDSGGIVTGPTIASLAQDNRPEAIIPLDQLTKIIGGGGGNTYNISVNGGGNAEEIARAIRGAIEDYDREKNRSGAYA